MLVSSPDPFLAIAQGVATKRGGSKAAMDAESIFSSLWGLRGSQ
jgi:hypothetical protein